MFLCSVWHCSAVSKSPVFYVFFFFLTSDRFAMDPANAHRLMELIRSAAQQLRSVAGVLDTLQEQLATAAGLHRFQQQEQNLG